MENIVIKKLGHTFLKRGTDLLRVLYVSGSSLLLVPNDRWAFNHFRLKDIFQLNFLLDEYWPSEYLEKWLASQFSECGLYIFREAFTYCFLAAVLGCFTFSVKWERIKMYDLPIFEGDFSSYLGNWKWLKCRSSVICFLYYLSYSGTYWRVHFSWYIYLTYLGPRLFSIESKLKLEIFIENL